MTPPPPPPPGPGSAIAPAPRELVLRFLASIGRPTEAQFYLELFRAEHPERFAIIHVADTVMRHAAEALLVDVRFLAELGLSPVMVFGAVKPRLAHRFAERVRDALAPTIPCSIVNPSDTAEVARGGRMALVPLASGYGGPGEDDAAVDARFAVLADMATSLGTRKIVFLGRRSGLQPKDGRVVSLIDLTSERERFLEPGVLPANQAKLLRQIGRIVDRIPHRLTVSVTSPLDLLRELFTVKGAGTLVRRGSRIVRHAGWASLDRERLRDLIEDAFARPLRDEFVDQPARAIYVADDYRGAAVVTDTPLAPYLSKFAVTTEARGEGVGRDLWRVMEDELPRLYWRSRASNPITAWYREQSEGMVRRGDWWVLWRGLAPAEIPVAIEYAGSLPADFST